jgi:hypothetical protein
MHPRSPPVPVNESFLSLRQLVMHNVSDFWYIETAGCKISSNKNMVDSSPEFDKVLFPVYLFERTMENSMLKVVDSENGADPLHCIPVVAKNQAYLIFKTGYQPHQSINFVRASGMYKFE